MNAKSAHLLYLCLFCLVVCGCAKIKNVDSPGQNIICFGNSLTSGEGASSGNDYPSILSGQIKFPVINAGGAGDTTEEALKRIDSDVLSRNPKLVIVEFGGNDFLRGMAKEKTLKNLETIVKKIQDAKAMVVLLEVRTALVGDTYLPGFKKIAQERGALLIADILKGVITNPKMKSDYIHPNDEGYRVMAARIAKVIKRILY